MRTEMQKKMDKVAGISDVEYKLSVKTGKIVETGTICKSFDGEALEKSLPGYKNQIAGIEKQLNEAKAKMKLCEGIEETEDLKNFIDMQRQAGLLQQKKGLVDVVKKREDELQFHRDNYKDQTRLLNEWRDWKKKFRKPAKEKPAEEKPSSPVVS